MRAVVQRVSRGSVTVEGERVGNVDGGFVVLLGVREDDTPADVDYIADKIAHLRVFEDEQGKLNLSLQDVGGGALIISQFTLYGDARKGRRPSFTEAARGEAAQALYQAVCERVASHGIAVERGRFGAHMEVSLVNDGPVTLLLDSRRGF